MIFTNGSGAQTPGASQPGIEFSGKVSWDGSVEHGDRRELQYSAANSGGVGDNFG